MESPEISRQHVKLPMSLSISDYLLLWFSTQGYTVVPSYLALKCQRHFRFFVFLPLSVDNRYGLLDFFFSFCNALHPLVWCLFFLLGTTYFLTSGFLSYTLCSEMCIPKILFSSCYFSAQGLPITAHCL